MTNPYLGSIQTIGGNLLDILVLQATQWIVKLLSVVVIVLVGYIVAKVIKQIVIKLLQSTKIDQWVDEQNLTAAIGGREVSILAGSIVKWWIVVVVLQQSLIVLQLDVLGGFLGALANYILLALVAMVMIIIGLLLARYARNAIQSTTHSYKKPVGVISELVIIYLAVILALRTIGLNVTILEDAFRIAFAAFALVLAITVGISFGLAFRTEAQKMVSDIKKLAKK
jgi:hypothetical protein